MPKHSTSNKLHERPQIKKMSFFSAIVFVIGSSIGAGIFIKNWNVLGNTQFTLFYAILAWVIALIGMVCLCFALVEICSASQKANSQSSAGWLRVFGNKFLYNASKNYIAYLRIPIYLVIMPYYMIMVSQQAFGYSMTWWGALLITLGLGLYHIWFVGLFSRVANISNWIVTIIEMFPVLFASVSGFIIIGHDNLYDGASWFKPANPDNESTTITSFAQLSLFLGVLNSLPAIFFTFDGFHNVASLQSELREPKKMPKTMCIGTTIVAALEIIVAVSLLIGCKDGSLFGIKSKLFSQIFIQIMLICVIIGMLSVVGSNACFAPRFYESLISHNECPKFLLKYKKSLNSNRPIVGSVITSIVFLSTLFIVALAGYFFWDISKYRFMCSVTGEFIYNNGSNPSETINDLDPTHMAGTLSFVDIIGQWAAAFSFLWIIIAVICGLVNRKTKKINVIKSKYFIPCAIIATTIIGIGITFIFVNSLGDLVISIRNLNAGPPWPVGDWTKKEMFTNFIGSILSVIFLFVFIFIIFHQYIISKLFRRKKTKLR